MRLGGNRRELTDYDFDRMRIPERYRGVVYGEIQESCEKVLRGYASSMSEFVSKGAGLLLWGPNGSGKTSAAVVIGKEMRRRGLTVLFLSHSEVKEAVIRQVVFDESQSLWDRAESVDVLILDDLGKSVEDSTGFGARVLDNLLRKRNSDKLISIVTTNMPPKKLPELLKASTLHSLKESVVPMRFVGADLRESTKNELTALVGGDE